MTNPGQFSPEVRERAVLLVRDRWDYDTQWAASRSIASKIGCAAETLRLCSVAAVAHLPLQRLTNETDGVGNLV